ncbi:MAG TPA: organic hydroperoxide resistance protein [Mycobacteriales bacterium]|nr:organic hydroperoxide resistance protein [Mycobacteriales bacterium]
MTKVLYTAKATAEGGREGHTASDDGRLDVKLVPPVELGGPAEGVGTNPEQLFAAGYSSCFHSALKLVARRMKLDAEGSTVTAEVGIGPAEGMVGYGLAVRLVIALPKVDDAEQAQQLVDTAHQVCPYSNAIRGNVDVELSLA